MANITIDRDEAYNLPQVCMQCGDEATTTVTKNFSWAPPHAAMFGAIGRLAMTRYMTVEAPFCEAHRNHWMKRTLILLGGFLGVALIGVPGLIAWGMSTDTPALQPIGLGLTVLGGVALVVWIIAALIVENSSIRPTRIGDHEISLSGVSPEFARAVREQQDDDDDYDDRRGPIRRRR